MNLLDVLIDAYSVVILIAVVLSWLRQGPGNPLARFVRSLTEPVLEPIRRMLPEIGGLDLSPIVLLLVLRAIRTLI
jgi:YggT family protein